jgi:hypothetical protein
MAREPGDLIQSDCTDLKQRAIASGYSRRFCLFDSWGYGENRADLKEKALIKHRIAAIGIAMFIAVALSSAQAYEVTEHVWIGGVIAGAYQYQFLTDDEDGTDEGGGAVPLQPEVGVRLSDTDTIFIKFGFAADDGLNAKSPFSVSPWAADLEADVKNINGRDRDYLLTAWYQHVFEFKPDYTLSITAGLIDATDYLDENAFANDEYTQFMNAALTNGPNVFLPSYDIGGALKLAMSRLAIRTVVMNVGENDDGNNSDFSVLSFRPGCIRVSEGYPMKSHINQWLQRLSHELKVPYGVLTGFQIALSEGQYP